MCRLLGYIGSSILLDNLLSKPEHSLIVQSYQPREMNSGVVNADGFGFGWYDSEKNSDAFTYKNTIPIWNDINLGSLGRYVESECILGYVRSATADQGVDLSNCQPFEHQRLLYVHNGKIEKFRQTLSRPLRNRLGDIAYQSIKGNTDSEHFFALLLDQLQANPSVRLEQALKSALSTLEELALAHQVVASANIIVSDGQCLVASRFAIGDTPAPSLYWIRDEPAFPAAVIIASEPLFAGDWHSFPEQSIIRVEKDLDIQYQA